jgi:LysM repeat protein
MSALVISTAGPAVKYSESKFGSVRATPAGALRLTRRGRMVFLGIPALVVTAVLMLSAVAVLLGVVASPANAATKYTPVNMADYAATVTVLQGQSLWSIAAKSDPNRDVRDVVAEIVALNDLGTSVLQAGQQLYVPLPK